MVAANKLLGCFEDVPLAKGILSECLTFDPVYKPTEAVLAIWNEPASPRIGRTIQLLRTLSYHG